MRDDEGIGGQIYSVDHFFIDFAGTRETREFVLLTKGK